MSETIYKYDNSLNPIFRAVLAYDSYDHDVRENLISTTSLMQPTQMLALRRSNKDAGKEIDLVGMIPSMYGTALHSHFETAINGTSDDKWKALGIPSPDELEVLQEVRMEREIDGYIISGKYDIMVRYKTPIWGLMDIKSGSVWSVMIDKPAKIEEWRIQMSIYRWLNQDKDIQDEATVLSIYTDWAKTQSVIQAKSGYPQERIENHVVMLMSIDETETYIKDKLSALTLAEEKYAKHGDTGAMCSEKELWMKKSGFAYYSKKEAKRATKVCETFDDAEQLRLKAKDSTAYVEERKAKATRCSYCSVTEYCPQFASHLVKGMI